MLSIQGRPQRVCSAIGSRTIAPVSMPAGWGRPTTRWRPTFAAVTAETIYQSLRIDPHLIIPDQQGRPVRMIEGGEPLTNFFPWQAFDWN